MGADIVVRAVGDAIHINNPRNKTNLVLSHAEAEKLSAKLDFVLQDLDAEYEVEPEDDFEEDLPPEW